MFIEAPKWRYWSFEGHDEPGSLKFKVYKYYAYVDWKSEEWDMLEDLDLAWPDWSPTWVSRAVDERDEDKHIRYSEYWKKHVPDANKAHLVVYGFIPYERILAIDEIGDARHPPPPLAR